MTHGLKGFFVVIDGLDGTGKGVVQGAILDHLKAKGLRVLDLHEFWEKHHLHPDFDNKAFNGRANPVYVDLASFDVISSSEPTHAVIGLAIREELVAKNGRKYSARITAECFASDRAILYKRVHLPALRAGKTIIQQRSVSTSIVYQPLQSTEQGEEEISVEEIMTLGGNTLALAYSPDLLIIPTLKEPEKILERLSSRKKDDNAQFENLDFQLKVKPLYESKDLQDLFERRGTHVRYIDAGISVEETRKQALAMFLKESPSRLH